MLVTYPQPATGIHERFQSALTQGRLNAINPHNVEGVS